jgi:ribonuclease Z
VDLSLLFAGTAGSAPTRGRGLPATVLSAGGDRLLIDCGEGTQRQLLRSPLGLADLDAVFLTHFHLDHWYGLPPMLRTFALREREKPLVVHGPRGVRDVLGSVAHLIGKLPYGLEVRELEPGDEVRFTGYALHAFAVEHRAPAFGYALVEDARPGRFDAEAARRLGIEDVRLFGALQRGETVQGVAPEQVLGAPRPGRKLVLSGDTGPAAMLRLAAHEADVLVHEATFLEVDAARARQTRHSTAAQAAELAREAGVGLLCLTHLSGRYPPSDVQGEAASRFDRVHVPRDFDTVVVPFPEKGPPEVVRPERRPVREPVAPGGSTP